MHRLWAGYTPTTASSCGRVHKVHTLSNTIRASTIVQINHKHRNLWIESDLLSTLVDESNNPKTLRDFLFEIKKYAISRAVLKYGCSKKNATGSEEYKNTLGWMGEVLCEFWLHTFGHRYDLSLVKDTSENQFQRGYDFTSSVLIDESISSIIQVKMQKEDKSFTKQSLFTFFDEAFLKNIQPRYTILMVPTNELPKGEILSWKDDFKTQYSSQLIFIGQKEMDRNILSLPTTVQGENPNLEFFIRFRESLNESCADIK